MTPTEAGDPDYELAQVNIGRLVAPVDDPLLAEFMEALDPVNAAADGAPGFVWRLQTENGNATGIEERTATSKSGTISDSGMASHMA